MWNTTENEIPALDILRDHLDTLQKAADMAFEYETISIREVHKAFDYFYVNMDHKHGLFLYQRGLAQRNPKLMKEGVAFIKKYYGEM